MLLLDYAISMWDGVAFTLYGLPFTSLVALTFARDLILGKHLFFFLV